MCKQKVSNAQETVQLNAVEARIFDTLLAAREHHGLQTTLRCAGGWVRDKLLGRGSKDIDIAVDDMTGKEFGDKVVQYQQAQARNAPRWIHSALLLRGSEVAYHLRTMSALSVCRVCSACKCT